MLRLLLLLVAWLGKGFPWPEALVLLGLGVLYALRIGLPEAYSPMEQYVMGVLVQVTGSAQESGFPLTHRLLQTLLALSPLDALTTLRLAMTSLFLATLAGLWSVLRLVGMPRLLAILLVLVPATSMGGFTLARTLTPLVPAAFWLTWAAVVAVAAVRLPVPPQSPLYPASGWLGLVLALVGYELGLPLQAILLVLGGVWVWLNPVVDRQKERLSYCTGFGVATGLCLVFLGLPSLATLPLADALGRLGDPLNWSSLQDWGRYLMQCLWGAFPWSLLGVAGVLRLVSGTVAPNRPESRYASRHRRPTAWGASGQWNASDWPWGAVLLGVALLLLLLLGALSGWVWLGWLALLVAAGALLYTTQQGRATSTSLFHVSLDLTALWLGLMAIGLSWWLYFELPEQFPLAYWPLPGLAQWGVTLGKQGDWTLPLWKLWWVFVPVWLLLGGLLVALAQPLRARLQVGFLLAGWSVVWLAYVGLVSLPLLHGSAFAWAKTAILPRIQRAGQPLWVVSPLQRQGLLFQLFGPTVSARIPPGDTPQLGVLSVEALTLRLKQWTADEQSQPPVLYTLMDEQQYYGIPWALREKATIVAFQPAWQVPGQTPVLGALGTASLFCRKHAWPAHALLLVRWQPDLPPMLQETDPVTYPPG